MKTYKRIAFLLIFAFIANFASAQYAVDNIMRKYKNDEGVITWAFKNGLENYIKRDDGKDLKSTFEKLEFIIFTNGDDVSNKDKKKLSLNIEKDAYETLIEARSDGRTLKIVGIEEGDFIKKVFAQVQSKEMNGYFFLYGQIYFEDLANLDFKKLMDIDI